MSRALRLMLGVPRCRLLAPRHRAELNRTGPHDASRPAGRFEYVRSALKTIERRGISVSLGWAEDRSNEIATGEKRIEARHSGEMRPHPEYSFSVGHKGRTALSGTSK